MKLSIITVNLNNALGLRKTIESVISQTYTDYEYLIIDGGSTDESVEVIKEYSEEITYWISETDKGIYNAMNKGVLKAKGEYLQFLNSGDWLLEKTIFEKVFCGINSADIIYGNTILSKHDDTSYLYVSKPIEDITLAYFFSQTIQHQSSFIKRDLFKEILYDETLKIVADRKFFIQQTVFQNCSLQRIDLPLVNVNINGISCDPQFWPLRKNEGESVLQSIIPPRIRADYNRLLPLLDSPLLKDVDLLNHTQGFQRLVVFVVHVLIKTYGLFRKIK